MAKPVYTGLRISRREYLKHTAEEWEGVEVITTQELRNGNLVIPPGTRLMIDGKLSGFSLTGPKCPCCGLQPRINRVQPHCLEIPIPRTV